MSEPSYKFRFPSFLKAHVIPLVTLARKVHKVVEEGF